MVGEQYWEVVWQADGGIVGVGGGSNLLAKSKGGLQALLGYLRDWFRLGISYDVLVWF